MLEHLRSRLRALLDERTAGQATLQTIMDAASSEARDYSDSENATWTETRTRIDGIDSERTDIEARITELEHVASSAAAAADMVTRLGAPVQQTAARVKAEARTYTAHSSQEGRSFFSDAMAANLGDFDARSRIERHSAEVRAEGELETRAVSTTGFSGLAVPQYLVDLAAPIARNGQPLANLVTQLPLPDQGMSLIIPRGTTGATEASQATENTNVSSTDEVWSNLTVPVVTIAGQQDVSRQSIERGAPGLDTIIYMDLAAAYVAEKDRQIIAGSGASNQMLGIINTAGISAASSFAAVATASAFSLKFAGQVAAIEGAGTVVAPATLAVMNPRRWGWLAGQVDSTGRPIVVPPVNGPFNAFSVNAAAGQYSGHIDGSTTIKGYIQGIPTITDANIPTTIGTLNEDVVLLMNTSHALLWQVGDGLPQMLRFDQTLGNQLTVKLVAYSYAAFTAGRYPAAFGKIGGLDATATFGLVAPSF